MFQVNIYKIFQVKQILIKILSTWVFYILHCTALVELVESRKFLLVQCKQKVFMSKLHDNSRKFLLDSAV